MTAIRALLAGIVDYAGLFPPAGLDLVAAAHNYAAYRASDDGWMLGRFVVPVARLRELVVLLEAKHRGLVPWRLAVLVGDDVQRDLAFALEFNDAHAGVAAVDCVEAKLADRDAIERAADAAAGLELFTELPAGGEVEPLLAVLVSRGVRAKLRTGGVIPGAFPGTANVVRFMRLCVEAGLPFKATAGLHHPITASYPLTYEPDAPTNRMFGFVNLFLSAAALATGAREDEASRLLEERDAHAFTVRPAAIRWRDREMGESAIARARSTAARSFGSCSFREPVDGVAELWGAP
ncbi:MAG: hypothetical protein ACHQWU_04385 [Gemmatimonadales bacterium]